MQRPGVAARQVGAPDRAPEQRIAGEQDRARAVDDLEAYRARRVPGRVDDLDRVIAERDPVAVLEYVVTDAPIVDLRAVQ